MLERNNSMPLSLFLQAERHARIERSLVINDCIRGTMRKLAEWLSALGAWGTRLARDLAAERLLRSAIRELHQLDDRTRSLTSASSGVGSNPPCETDCPHA